MAILTNEVFKYRFALRRIANLTNPRIFRLEDLKLPRQSIYHFIGDDTVVGPSLQDPLLEGIKRIIPVSHVIELEGELLGNPRLMPSQPMQEIRNFHQNNRQFRRALNVGVGTRDPMVPYFINYSLINRRYRYIKNMFSNYYRWKNFEHTLYGNMNKLGEETDWNQYIKIDLPEQLPSLSLLKQSTNKMNMSLLKKFGEGNSLMILEFWKWLGENREDSILNMIKPEHYGKINFILVDSGCWTLFNMGVLNSWRLASKEEREKDPSLPKKGFEPKKLQLLFLRYLMNFLLVRSGGADVLNALEETVDEVDNKDKQKLVDKPEIVDASTDVKDIEEKKTVGVGHVVKKVKDKLSVTDVPDKAPDSNNSHTQTFSNSKLKSAVVIPEEVDPPEPEVNSIGEYVLGEQLEKAIAEDMAALDKINEVEEEEDKKPEFVVLKANDDKTPTEDVMVQVQALADENMLSAAEYRRYEKLSQKYQTLNYPGTDKTLAEMAIVNKQELVLDKVAEFKDNPTVFDKSMLKSTLVDFDKQYVDKVMEKDIAACILNMQKVGYCVTDIEKDVVVDAGGSYANYKIKIQPVDGAASTLWVKLPVIDKEGNYKANNTSYRMRKQRADLPIRKVAPDKVALTSYYPSKLSVVRSSKKVTDYAEWLRNQIMVKGLDNEDETVLEVKPTNVFRSDVKTPRLYSLLSMRFSSFKLAGYTWYLDYSHRTAAFDTKESGIWEKDGALLVGKNDKGDLLLMSADSKLYSIKIQDKVPQAVPMGSIESLLGVDMLKAPIDIVSLKVLGKLIPVGFILAYELGLEKLINSLGIEYRRVMRDGRLNLAENEWRLTFEDESLVFKRDDVIASMVLAGLRDFHREIKRFSVYDFDRKDVYLNLLEAVGLSVRYLREIDLLYSMFIDPITRDILEDMGEPTSFRGLLVRSVELLQSDEHPDEVDPAFMRIRGYERIPGALYGELIKSIRVHNSRAGKSKVSVDLNPFAVWRAIDTDPAVSVSNEINPIENLKEIEAVTYSGTGGRTGKTLLGKTRAFHKNDLGIMSEATKDSSDVGVNVYLSANPNFTSLRGIARPYDDAKDGFNNIFSTTFNLSPTIEQDDAKRANFVNIQASHGLACPSYQVPVIRTGQESLMAYRTSSLYASTAQQEGTVTELTDKVLTITYKDGTTHGVEIGTRYGNSAGLVIPHEIVTDLKLNGKVKAGDVLAYNKGFFEKDLLTGGVVFKQSYMANVVVFETSMTDEDSSVVSQRLANKLSTRTTKVRNITLNFDQNVRNMVKVGTEVKPTDLLCVIEDSMVGDNTAFDDSVMDTLRLLGSQTPLAKSSGVIERIEVFYNGEQEDMSESLRKMTREFDKQLAAQCKAMGKKVYTGQVDEGFRVDGQALLLDTVVIKVYINGDVSCTSGDKLVMGLQMKSIIGEILPEPMKTEDGTEVDIQFGRRAIAARIVNSPDLIGTTTTLLEVIAKKAFEVYSK